MYEFFVHWSPRVPGTTHHGEGQADEPGFIAMETTDGVTTNSKSTETPDTSVASAQMTSGASCSRQSSKKWQVGLLYASCYWP